MGRMCMDETENDNEGIMHETLYSTFCEMGLYRREN